MREREAVGNDLMDIIGDVGSLNQILCPSIQGGFFPILKVHY